MMHNPPHPGEFIREVCLEPLGLSVTKAAEHLGVTRKTLSELLNGYSGISTEMAIRLGIAFNTTPESWLTQQMNYDLWKARKKEKNLDVHPLWKGGHREQMRLQHFS
jgi:addiction module HigA family antidote